MGAKNKALKKKVEHYIGGDGKRRTMPDSMKTAISSINHKYALSVKRREDK